MNLKLTLAATTAALASIAISTSAEAITLGSKYTIAGQGTFSPTQLTFQGPHLVTAASGDFGIMAPVQQGEFAIAAAPGVFDINVPGTGLLVDFKDASFFGILETKNIFDFFATSVTFVSGLDRYRFTGTFGDGTKGIGELAQLLEVSGESGAFGYAATFTAVPTPALLPGLIGLGVAALRRKDEESEEENA